MKKKVLLFGTAIVLNVLLFACFSSCEKPDVNGETTIDLNGTTIDLNGTSWIEPSGMMVFSFTADSLTVRTTSMSHGSVREYFGNGTYVLSNRDITMDFVIIEKDVFHDDYPVSYHWSGIVEDSNTMKFGYCRLYKN